MRGRASSLYQFAFIGISPFGGLFLGTLAGVSGALLYAAGGTLGLATAFLAAARLRVLRPLESPALMSSPR